MASASLGMSCQHHALRPHEWSVCLACMCGCLQLALGSVRLGRMIRVAVMYGGGGRLAGALPYKGRMHHPLGLLETYITP